MEKIDSFIPAALTAMSEGSGSMATLANLTLKREGATPMNQIISAFIDVRRAWGSLAGRDAAVAAESREELRVKPGQFLSFTQLLMNKVCWNARRLNRSVIEQEADDRLNGIDFSQDVAEEVGIDDRSRSNVKEAVDQDFEWLLKLHSYLAREFPQFSDIEDFVMFRQSERVVDKETGLVSWNTVGEAMDFDSTMHLMDEIAEDLREQSALESDEKLQALTFVESESRITPPAPKPKEPKPESVSDFSDLETLISE